jgi:hypothetical protein
MAEKIIKNSARSTSVDTADHLKYVPQYLSLGISPEIRNFQNIVDIQGNLKADANPLGIPNVGNNEEHSWINSLNGTSLPNLDETYLLIAKDKLIMIGSHSEIQKELEKIFYQDNNGDHEYSIDDVVVLKKIPIKIGIFIE